MDFGAKRSAKPAASVEARADQTICVVLRAETHPGREGEFLRLVGEFARKVREHEPDCLSYSITRVLGAKEHFAVHARFRGWQPLEAHAETPHLNAAMPRLMALLASAVSMEIFLEV